MTKQNQGYFFRLHKESSGQTYCKIWKYENGKTVYVRSCGTAELLNRRLEHYESRAVPNQEKRMLSVPKNENE